MSASLPIFDVAVTGMARATRSLPHLLGIFWLPWLMGTVALVVLEAIVEDQLRLGPAPGWARNIVWSPFAAMAYLMLLRWLLDGEPPPRSINLDVGRETWLAAPFVAAWFVASDTVSAAPIPMLTWLVLPSDVLAYRWDDVAAYAYAFQLAAWLLNAALLPCGLGLLVVVAKSRRLDLREFRHLLWLAPVSLFCASVVTMAAVGGLWILASHALAWLRLDQLAPKGMIPWRMNIHWAFIAELPYFPPQFLEFAIQGCILAEVYRRLLLEGSRQ
jgi:hypothetical protein